MGCFYTDVIVFNVKDESPKATVEKLLVDNATVDPLNKRLVTAGPIPAGHVRS